jgi:hypothetical protein
LFVLEKNPLALLSKFYNASSAFTPGGLLREARREKNLRTVNVPENYMLDPDGDIVCHLRVTGHAEMSLKVIFLAGGGAQRGHRELL